MVAIKDMDMPSCCYDCLFAENKRTNDYGTFGECGILEAYKTINLLEHSKHPNCPLVEIEERKVGEWIKTGGSFRCSECMAMPEFKDIRTLKYCPKCGAEMRGNENEENI